MPHSAIARIEAEEDPHSRPAGVAAEPPLEPIRALLEAAGLPVPRRYGHDVKRGIELLEDLGDCTLEDEATCAPAERRRALYAAACALVPRLQSVPAAPQVEAFARRLDAPLFGYKAEQVARWLLPAVLGRDANDSERVVVHDAFDEICVTKGMGILKMRTLERHPAYRASRQTSTWNSQRLGRLVLVSMDHGGAVMYARASTSTWHSTPRPTTPSELQRLHIYARCNSRRVAPSGASM